MSKYDDLAKRIIEFVGKEENIISLTHCVTRLRFQLKDEKKANDEELKQLEGIITVMHTAGQYQIVIGNHVGDVYEAVYSQIPLSANETGLVTSEKKLSFKERFIDLLTSIFMPSISILCACGMIKGLNSILQFLGLYSDTSGIYTLINAIGDCVFYFFPIVIGYNSARKFKLTPYIGMMIGAALCYPAINGVDLEIFGMQMNVTYTSTVLPVILTTALAAPMERWLNKMIPDMIKSFFTPMIVLLVATILGFIVIGPIANALSTVISEALCGIYNISPLLAGILVGGCWQIMVVFGVHMTLVVLAIMNIAEGNPDPILSLSVFVAFSQAAVVLAIALKTKNKKLKATCIPAFISSMFGVTEPAIYGVTLPRIKMFIISCIGGAVSGGFAGYTGLKYQQMAGLGIFELPAMFPKDGIQMVMVQTLAATGIAFVIGFIFAYLFYKDEESAQEKYEIIRRPIQGTVLPLCSVEDDAFAQGVLGQGAAIDPADGNVYAPFDGTVLTLFPTKHAIGLISDTGCELLIHIGMDTVKLEGRYFKAYVAQGEKVKQGQHLLSFDIEKIKAAGYSIHTPVIITNSTDYTEIKTIDKDGILMKISYAAGGSL